MLWPQEWVLASNRRGCLGRLGGKVVRAVGVRGDNNVFVQCEWSILVFPSIKPSPLASLLLVKCVLILLWDLCRCRYRALCRPVFGIQKSSDQIDVCIVVWNKLTLWILWCISSVCHLPIYYLLFIVYCAFDRLRKIIIIRDKSNTAHVNSLEHTKKNDKLYKWEPYVKVSNPISPTLLCIWKIVFEALMHKVYVLEYLKWCATASIQSQ